MDGISDLMTTNHVLFGNVLMSAWRRQDNVKIFYTKVKDLRYGLNIINFIRYGLKGQTH